MDKEKEKSISWGQCLAEHAAGTVIIASCVAGIVGIRAGAKGLNVVREMKGAGVFGAFSGLGFGRPVYSAIFHGDKSDSETQRNWREKINSERSDKGLGGLGR